MLQWGEKKLWSNGGAHVMSHTPPHALIKMAAEAEAGTRLLGEVAGTMSDASP
jgi:hypothetical protein